MAMSDSQERERRPGRPPKKDQRNFRRGARLVEEFEAALRQFGTEHAEMLRARTGFGRPPQTLQEIGENSSPPLSRERVRKIVKWALRLIGAELGWEERLSSISRAMEGRADPLFVEKLPGLDPWFAGCVEAPALVSVVVAEFCDGLHVMLAAGRPCVAKIGQGHWDAACRRARASVAMMTAEEKHDPDAVKIAVQALLPEESQELVGELVQHCIAAVRETSGADEGRTMAGEILVALEKEGRPLHSADLQKSLSLALGRRPSLASVRIAAQKAAIPLSKDIYVLRQHLPVNDERRTAIVSACEEIARKGKRGRKWHASEFVERLQAMLPDPENLDPFIVGALLSGSSALAYAGRQRWQAAPATHRETPEAA
jgi:hypothetical protein